MKAGAGMLVQQPELLAWNCHKALDILEEWFPLSRPKVLYPKAWLIFNNLGASFIKKKKKLQYLLVFILTFISRLECGRMFDLEGSNLNSFSAEQLLVGERNLITKGEQRVWDIRK